MLDKSVIESVFFNKKNIVAYHRIFRALNILSKCKSSRSGTFSTLVHLMLHKRSIRTWR